MPIGSVSEDSESPPASDPHSGADNPVDAVVGRALNLLARREHSAHELRTKLAARGYVAADIDVALARLKAKSLQSDTRFAQSLARHRIEGGYGPRRIDSELRMHHVDASSLGDLLADEDWLGRARAIARKRGGASADSAMRMRLARLLERRGFPSAIIGKALKQPIADSASDPFDGA